MNDLFPLFLAFMAGIIISLFYFGGLWWTVRRIQEADQPRLLLAASFLIRTAVTLVAFYLLAAGHWQRLLASILGFFLARTILLYWQRNKLEDVRET
jgi:F1F0 ATPase subunit 2